MMYRSQILGVGAFPVLWFGQLISTLGSGLTSFGIGVWVYQKTESVTQFALIAFFALVPGILLSPLVGALVDRWDRRWTLILSDSGAGLCTLILALLAWSKHLETWNIYLLVAMSSAFVSFNWPALTAATTLLISKRHFSRAAAMTQIGSAITQIASPFLAGLLLGTIGLFGLILVDIATFLFAVVTLLVIRIPKPPISAEGAANRGSLLRDATFGWRYIRLRPGLMGLLLLLVVTNFSVGIVQALITPLILSFASVKVLGVVLSAASSGLLVGSIGMSIWGGPKRRVAGILGALLIQGLILFMGGVRPSALLVAGAGFIFLLVGPVIYGCSQAIWQSKVAPDIQGRVFAARRFIAASMTPVAFLVAGPLADRLFEPLLAADGALADSVGKLIGVGDGRGIGFMLILVGSLSVLAVTLAWRYQRFRHLEDEIPDAVPVDVEIVVS